MTLVDLLIKAYFPYREVAEIVSDNSLSEKQKTMDATKASIRSFSILLLLGSIESEVIERAWDILWEKEGG